MKELFIETHEKLDNINQLLKDILAKAERNKKLMDNIKYMLDEEINQTSH